MGNEDILKLLKNINYWLYDNNGIERVTYIREFEKLNLSEGRIRILKKIRMLVVNTDIVREPTKMYILDKDIQVSTVLDKLNSEIRKKNELILSNVKDKKLAKLEKEYERQQVQNMISYDKMKLSKRFLPNMLTDIIYNKKYPLESIELTVNELIQEYNGEKKLTDYLDINLNQSPFIRRYNGDFIGDYGGLIVLMLNSSKKIIEDYLNNNKQFLGYFNYLISGLNSDSDIVNEDRKKLIDILSGDSSALQYEICINTLNNLVKLNRDKGYEVSREDNIKDKEIIIEDYKEVDDTKIQNNNILENQKKLDDILGQFSLDSGLLDFDNESDCDRDEGFKEEDIEEKSNNTEILEVKTDVEDKKIEDEKPSLDYKTNKIKWDF